MKTAPPPSVVAVLLRIWEFLMDTVTDPVTSMPPPLSARFARSASYLSRPQTSPNDLEAASEDRRCVCGHDAVFHRRLGVRNRQPAGENSLVPKHRRSLHAHLAGVLVAAQECSAPIAARYVSGDQAVCDDDTLARWKNAMRPPPSPLKVPPSAIIQCFHLELPRWSRRRCLLRHLSHSCCE